MIKTQNKELYLIHWHEEEAQAIAAELEGWGWRVAGLETADGGRAYRQIKANPPPVVLIFLTRKPSHGRQTAVALGQLKAAKDCALIFVGGSETAVAQTRQAVPDGQFIAELQDFQKVKI